MTTVDKHQVRFPLARQRPLDPPDEYSSGRESSGLMGAKLWNDNPAWLVTRYEDVRKVLTSSVFSVAPSHANYPFNSASQKSMLLAEEPSILSMDGAEHAHYRRMFTAWFTVKKLEALRPKVERIVDDLIDGILRTPGEFDFYGEFALVVPSLVISELLGVPYEDHEFFQAVARSRSDLGQGSKPPVDAGKAILEYLTGMINRKCQMPDPGDDILGSLVTQQILPGHITVAYAATMGRFLLQAGHDTTANAIALGTLVLLQHPAQLNELRADPSLLPAAVEEVLRYTSVAHLASRRVAVEDIVVGGQQITAGDGVVALLASANRDSAVFDGPDTFNIHRPSNAHLAFADGIHQCLGQHLARMELNVILGRVVNRLPTLRLAVPVENIEFKLDNKVFGVFRLPMLCE